MQGWEEGEGEGVGVGLGKGVGVVGAGSVRDPPWLLKVSTPSRDIAISYLTFLLFLTFKLSTENLT